MRRGWSIFLLASACGGCGSETPTQMDPVESAPFGVPAEVTTWLNSTVVPFDGVHLSLPHDDLGVLRDLVGDARVVSLGENTHGTRDFFEMKARILRFLVEEMGFDAFMIEATWPESNRLDRYVRTGEGDPDVYLTGLYFWTWRTESVLEMIQWMRSHNDAGGSVGFYGFDMQYPGMALDNVIRYVADVDPAVVGETEARLDCLVRYSNDAWGRFPSVRYTEAGAAYQTECLDSLNAEGARLEANRDAYVAASSAEDFALTKRSRACVKTPDLPYIIRSVFWPVLPFLELRSWPISPAAIAPKWCSSLRSSTTTSPLTTRCASSTPSWRSSISARSVFSGRCLRIRAARATIPVISCDCTYTATCTAFAPAGGWSRRRIATSS